MKTDNSTPDYTLLLFLIALFIFNSPFSDWWSSLSLPWYSIFIFWLFIIALIAVKQHQRNRDDQH